MSNPDVSSQDKKLVDAMQRALKQVEQPPEFAKTWSAAERSVRTSKRRFVWGVSSAGVIAAVAAVVAVLNMSAPEPGPYVAVEELLGSTSWSAPSDSLLPQHEFDIYQELPVLIESTEPGEGALL